MTKKKESADVSTLYQDALARAEDLRRALTNKEEDWKQARRELYGAESALERTSRKLAFETVKVDTLLGLLAEKVAALRGSEDLVRLQRKELENR